MVCDRRMKIFLTGGTGYIGGVLARRLASEGRRLTCLVRATSREESVANLRKVGAEIHVGDLSDRESLRPGMEGADWVIHAGAELNRDDAMDGANVAGSQNIASLAVELGVRRFLSVSSIAYWGGSPADGTAGVEEDPVQSFPTEYSATKNAGENAIRAFCDQGLNVVSVHPSLVYGPPGKKNGANFFLYQMVHQNLPVLMAGDRKVSWVFVDDVVDAMVRIVGQDKSTGRYILAGEGETLRETATRVGQLAGVKVPKFNISVPTAKAMLHAISPIFRLVGKRLPVEPVRLDYLAKHWFFSDQRAQDELGWSPRSLERGLPPTVEMLLATNREFEAT